MQLILELSEGSRGLMGEAVVRRSATFRKSFLDGSEEEKICNFP